MKNSVRLMTPVNIIKVVTALQNPANHTKSGNHTGTVHKPNPRLDSGQFKRRI